MDSLFAYTDYRLFLRDWYAESKARCWRRLPEIRKYGTHRRLRQDQYAYHRAWRHRALRSLLPAMGLKDDWENAGRLLDPPITAKQARDSVELMLRPGLLARESRGRYGVAP